MKNNGFYVDTLKMLDETAFHQMFEYCGITLKGEQLALECAWKALLRGGAAASSLPPPPADDLPPSYDFVSPPSNAAPPADQTRSVGDQLRMVERNLTDIEIVLDEQETWDFLDRRLDDPSDKLKAAARELGTISVKASEVMDTKKKASLNHSVDLLTKRLQGLRVSSREAFVSAYKTETTTKPSVDEQLRKVEKRLYEIEIVVDQEESKEVLARRLDAPSDSLAALEKELTGTEVKAGELADAKKKASLANNVDLLKKRIRTLRLGKEEGSSQADTTSDEKMQIRVGDLKWKLHQQHALPLRNCPYGPGKTFACSMCRSQVSISFHCATDRYDVCVECVATRNPDTVKHAWRSASHTHPLILMSNPYSNARGEWRCDLCTTTTGTTKAVYHCPQCKFDCCIPCAVGITSRPSPSAASVSTPASNTQSNSGSQAQRNATSAAQSLLARVAEKSQLQEMWVILLEMHQSMKSTSLGNISLTAEEAQQSMRNMYVALVTYENAINGSAQRTDWVRWKRRQWRDEIQRSSNWSLAHFATCALAVEQHVLQDAQTPTFLLLTRDMWRLRCVRAGGTEMEFDDSAQSGGNLDGATLLRLLQLLS